MDTDKKSTWKTGLIKTLRVVLIIYLLLCFGVYFLQAKLVFVPTVGEPGRVPSELGLEYEDLRLKSGNEQIHAWFVPARNARGTVLFCHGNAGNLGHRLATIKIWNDLGMNILLFDYRGFGSSTGAPTEEGCYEDVMACYNWLTENNNLKKPLVIHGRSLGGGIASWAANQLDCDGLILESTFTSIPDMGAHYYPFLPVSLISSINFRSIDEVKKLKVPLLVAHGPADEIIPYHMGKKLAKEGNCELIELIGDHNNGFEISPKYIPALRKFISQVSSKN